MTLLPMRAEGRGDGITSLIEAAKINGVEPFGYGKAALEAIGRIRALEVEMQGFDAVRDYITSPGHDKDAQSTR